MSNFKVTENPNHFMVLDAISKGVKNIDKITRVTKLRKEEVELIVNDLSTRKLIVITEKKGFFGNKKVELGISHTGLQLLNSKKAELEKQWQQIQKWYDSGNKGALQQYMQDDTNRMWMPMMLFSGIMNMMFFMTMMSFVGMAMSPAESGAVGGAEGGAAGAEDGGGAGAEGDSGAGGGDSGGGDFGGGDFSF